MAQCLLSSRLKGGRIIDFFYAKSLPWEVDISLLIAKWGKVELNDVVNIFYCELYFKHFISDLWLLE